VGRRIRSVERHVDALEVAQAAQVEIRQSTIARFAGDLDVPEEVTASYSSAAACGWARGPR
jgi:hypothetical protein